MTWQEWLNQQQLAGGGATAPAAAASIPTAALPSVVQGGAGGLSSVSPTGGGMGGIGSEISGLLGGIGDFTSGNTAAGLEGLGGTALLAGSPFAAETFGLSEVPGLVMELLGMFGVGGTSVPREAKTTALGGALEGSGNPLDAIVGQFIGQGAGAGRVLSESGSSTFGQSTEDLAAYLSALTGQQLPNVTATGFQHNPTFMAPGLGNAGSNFKIPAGYNFMDPSQAQNASSIIERIIGMQQPAGQLKPAQADWQKIVSQLISKGDLTKYNGPMGAAGGQPTSAGAIPNVSLPHPLAQNQPQVTPAPYPLTTGA
jgi:hypothetical protein